MLIIFTVQIRFICTVWSFIAHLYFIIQFSTSIYLYLCLQLNNFGGTGLLINLSFSLNDSGGRGGRGQQYPPPPFAKYPVFAIRCSKLTATAIHPPYQHPTPRSLHLTILAKVHSSSQKLPILRADSIQNTI